MGKWIDKMRWKKWANGFWVLTDKYGDGQGISVQREGRTVCPFVLEMTTDPRTGKPWRSMKAAREWFDQVTKIKARKGE